MKSTYFEALGAEAVLGLKQKLGEILSSLPPSDALSPVDRQRLPKMSEKDTHYLDQIAFLSKNYPNLSATFIDLQKMENTLKFREQMNDLRSILLNLMRKTEDLIIISGSAADEMSRLYYKNIKIAADHRLDGAQTLFNLMKTRYKKTKNNELPATVENAQTTH